MRWEEKKEEGRGSSNLPAVMEKVLDPQCGIPQFKGVGACPLCILQVATFEGGRAVYLRGTCAYSQLGHKVTFL